MDNFFPFFSSNANSNQEPHSMDLNNNFTTFPTSAYDHHHHMLPPYPNVACPMMMNPPFPYQIPVMPTGSEFGSMFSNHPGWRGEFHDPYMTKMARINRKNAMIRSRNNPNPNSAANELAEARRQMMLRMKNLAQAAAKKDLYRYCTFDNKILRVLLEKHLRMSDVGALGRIVLPKRDAEAHLPELADKEGMMLLMRDANSEKCWSFRYKYWCNNKSRMYVLENSGEFVKKNGVEMGDTLTILQDESKNLYFSIRKSDKPNEEKEDDPFGELDDLYVLDYMPNEEEASIDTLIGNLSGNFQENFAFDFDPSSLPPMDHLTNPQNVGSSSDPMSFEDSNW